MLYREAKSLGLEQGDYVIRQRLVQKMRYLIDDITEGSGEPGDAVLNDYLQKTPGHLYARAFRHLHSCIPGCYGCIAINRREPWQCRLRDKLHSAGRPLQ